ncbi:MAG: capsule assembly Wzi family protein [Muribaculaceae bacterium]|nr:capsule assembly Wzi family protein [Muribaculaceae bacterium]
MKRIYIAAAVAAAAFSSMATSPVELQYSASLELNASTGRTAPYMIGSWKNGRIPYKNSALLDLGVTKELDLGKRFDWSAGAEVLTGWQHSLEFDRYFAENKTWGTGTLTPSRIWLQQLYASVKYRGVFLQAGMKDNKSLILPDDLSSGDITLSNNARPVPEICAGFVDFQDIPLTEGWVQINGRIGYGRFMDDGFDRTQYNHYNWVIAQDVYYTYKRCHFRTKPSQPLSITVGMQTAGQFGGKSYMYSRGKLVDTRDRGLRLRYIWDMFFPWQGNGDSYYEGNSLGSWDFKARYRLPDESELSFAFEWPWEDGSGIGKLNGWDGLWGIYYSRPGRHLISGAALEYLDFRNQSGPLHYAPGDHTDTDITASATGGDNYYNNDVYSAYDNYGLSLGTPFLVSPLYNADGYPAYLYTRSRGFHAALKGCAGCEVDYRLMLSWQEAWGNGRLPRTTALHNTSMMAEARWNAARITPGLSLCVQAAFDSGNLRGDNFGAYISVKYQGNLTFKK